MRTFLIKTNALLPQNKPQLIEDWTKSHGHETEHRPAAESEADHRSNASTTGNDTFSVMDIAIAPADSVPPVTVTTALCTPTSALNERLAMISIKPPDGAQGRTPVDVCCVVDISGSMGCEARVQGKNGAVEEHGLSLLDIVKHAVRTVIHTLCECDRLALVAYSTDSRVVFDLTKMDADGRAACERKLNSLHCEDMTNLWAGLEMGLKVLSKGSCDDRIAHLFILTDG